MAVVILNTITGKKYNGSLELHEFCADAGIQFDKELWPFLKLTYDHCWFIEATHKDTWTTMRWWLQGKDAFIGSQTYAISDVGFTHKSELRKKRK